VFHRDHERERGQVLVIVALGLVVIVAMVGLVIDGGFAWGKQRDTQNGADAIAKAGAIVLAMNVAGVEPPKTDTDVDFSNDAAATENGLDADETVGYYTNITGQMLTITGALASSEANAAVVGGGTIPAGAAGVRAVADQQFDTFLARVIGINTMEATADATAVAGYLTGTCEADAGCIVLPVTFPVNILGCDGSNDPDFVTVGDPPNKILWDSPSDEALSIPLCKSGAGNVGWLDWTPHEGTPGCSGTGTAELECVINDPTNPYLKWPGWYQVANTGNINSPGVETALNQYDGEVVLIPQFDLTCGTTPSGPGVDDCPVDQVGKGGSNQWYHLAGMSSFRLCSTDPADDATLVEKCGDKGFTQGTYMNGSNPICDTGNGATSCLAGMFEEIVYEGEVQAQPGANSGSSVVGIQLIE
jgi:Flp pilus assembly protein TadG